MGNVMTVPCRSYSAQAFDSCPACVDAALDAVEQAGIYLLGRTASGVEDQLVGPFEDQLLAFEADPLWAAPANRCGRLAFVEPGQLPVDPVIGRHGSLTLHLL